MADLFGKEKVLGGLCFVCLNRVEPGVIQHVAHGAIVMGEYDRWPEPRTHEIAGMIRHSGVPCKVSDNLERAHWEKLVWNIPFNGLGVAGDAPLGAKKSVQTEEAMLWIKGTYGKGKYCPEDKAGVAKPCMDIEAVTRVMANSTDPAELLDAWQGWHRISPPMRKDYQRFVEMYAAKRAA